MENSFNKKLVELQSILDSILNDLELLSVRSLEYNMDELRGSIDEFSEKVDYIYERRTKVGSNNEDFEFSPPTYDDVEDEMDGVIDFFQC